VTGGLHRPAASAAAAPWACTIGPDDAGWAYSGLRVLELPAGQAHSFDTGANEALVVPLAGSCTVRCAGEQVELAGRPGVFAGPTDFAYLPPGAPVTVATVDGGRFAVPSARAERRFPFRYGAAAGVPVELRGAGSCSRQVHNFCTPESFGADRLIACEVLTPAGNWSSYPPHKHDEDRPGQEAVLEEIYYFEVAAGPAGPGVGYQRVYGTAARPMDVLAEIRTGDVVLIPHGWHGPSMAMPGYDLYYLNVMAGPGLERAWRIQDDPAHGWVRDTWAEQAIDPRLPFGSGSGGRVT
jgi:5-deoxy-glucuronate isomerase